MKCVLKDLIAVSKDGEWGKGEPFDDSVEMLAIRGTDFENVRVGSPASSPRRHIAKRHAERKILQPWDVIIEAAGGTKNQITGRTVLLRPQLFSRSGLPFTCASFSRFIRFKTELCDPEYMFWYLQHLYASGLMHAYHTQHTGVARFQWTTFSEREPLEIPPLPVQRRIAGILSPYDELIEKTQGRIRIIEKMVQAIYREWFVAFRFPGNERRSLVASALGEIPKGWEVKKLGDLVSYKRRGAKPGAHLNGRKYVPIDCLPSKSLALLEAKPIEAAQSSLQLFDKGDILFGAMRPYFHKVAIAPFDGVTRTTCFVFRPAQSEWSAFATLTVYDEATVAYANAHSQGATIPYAVWDGSLSEMPLVLPPDTLLRMFETIVAPMLARIAQFYFTLNNLRQTRDLLLPRLLSGNVTLPSATS